MFSWGIFNREFAIFSQQRPISALPWLKCIYGEQHKAVITLLNRVSLKLGARTLHSKRPECPFFATQLNGHRVQLAFLFSCVLIRSCLTPKRLDNSHLAAALKSALVFAHACFQTLTLTWHLCGVVKSCWPAWIPLLGRCPAAASWMCCSPSWLQDELTRKQEVRSDSFCYVDRRLALTSTDPLRHNRPLVVH